MSVETRAIASKFKETMQCNCDLDNWEPQKHTGHSWVCRIHKATIAVRNGDRKDPRALPQEVDKDE